MSGHFHWTQFLLVFPTEVPALLEAFSKLDEEQLREAVAYDITTCNRIQPGAHDYEEAQHIVEHLTVFANEELERRGTGPLTDTVWRGWK